MMYALAQSGGQGTPPLVSEENYLELAGQLELLFCSLMATLLGRPSSSWIWKSGFSKEHDHDWQLLHINLNVPVYY